MHLGNNMSFKKLKPHINPVTTEPSTTQELIGAIFMIFAVFFISFWGIIRIIGGNDA
jgi:hypothetical protein